jgi:hypothetical protein
MSIGFRSEGAAMGVSLTVRDESTDGRVTGESVIEFLTEQVTVEELIRGRVYQEVQDYNRKKSGRFQGLVRPSDSELMPNGYRVKTERQIDWKEQFETALKAYEAGHVILLVDDRQVTGLDETIDLRPGTAVTFLKMTPLVGG